MQFFVKPNWRWSNRLTFTFRLALLFHWGQAVFAVPVTVQDLVNQFDVANYFNIVSNKLYTRQGMNRVPLQLGGAEHDLCRDAIFDEFQRVGLNPYKDPWSYVDTTNNTLVNVCNIIAVKEGVQNPNNEIYVVGSHYDSKNNPGADDNATGVGCQLEMARIFAPQHFAKTIVFAIFDSEERWVVDTGKHRLGSLRYVDQHLNDNIKGMISVDMIGWQASGGGANRAAIYGRSGVMDPIRNDLAAAVTAYGGGLIPVFYSPGNISDHVAFADAGFQACLLIENGYSGNPNYHKLTDYVEMPGYLDWGYLEKMCKSVIGYYATQLQPVDVTPHLLSVQTDGNGGVLVTGAGLSRCKYAVELCTNLISPVWVAVETNLASVTDGTFTILDPEAGNRPGGFYRARFVAGYNGGGVAPKVTTRPLNRVIDTGNAVSLAITATGDAPLSYQWLLNDVVIPGATTNTYTIPSAQPTNAGDYAVIVVNSSGSATGHVASLTVYPPQVSVFSDDFDIDSSSNWTVSKSSTDTHVTFNYDYAADGISPAPHSIGGTTRGVKFEANLTAGVRAALSMSPMGQSFSGDYRLRFDMWINVNGRFPAGGTGSTEYLTAGLGTTGGRVQWTSSGSTADGYWFVTDGEGGASDTSTPADFGAYADTTIQSAASGVYDSGTDADARGNVNAYYATAFPGGQTPPAYQQSNYPQQTGALTGGCVGFAWRDVIIAKRGNIVEWSIDGVKLATFTNASVTASNVFVGYWDPYTSVSDNATLSFGLVDNVRVEQPAN